VTHNDLASWRTKFATEIIGESPLILEALETIQHVAETGCSILITGETGTGKELFARAVHRASSRRGRPFIAVHCAAIPETLLPQPDTLDLRTALENLERVLIDRALNRAGGNRTEAAALLGLNRTTLVEKLRKYAA
jgi:transcriptional regulator with PAS, ATPase and Fis domain